MLVLSLCKTYCPNVIPDNLGEKLGDGADGEVFELKDTNQVIKLSILCDYPHINLDEEYNRIFKCINYIKDNPSDIFAKVYSFDKLTKNYRAANYGWQNFIIYSYVMEKCFPISEDESKVFHSILSHEDLNIIKNYSESQIKKMLNGMARGLDFDAQRVIFFYQNLLRSPIKHSDLHIRNIMKNSNGDFKLIDFDRTTLEE